MRVNFLQFMSLITLITILSVIIILVVMLQSKGTGLSIIPNSSDFGKFERRGAEKIMHNITIVLIVAFVVACAAQYFFA